MAVNKKSQHVGNHGGRYTDIDGMTKQFTYVDHDKKTTISFLTDNKELWSEPKYRENLIQRILEHSASICPEIFTDFTLRGEGKKGIEWNTDMLIDNGVPSQRLRELATMLENRDELLQLGRKW